CRGLRLCRQGAASELPYQRQVVHDAVGSSRPLTMGREGRRRADGGEEGVHLRRPGYRRRRDAGQGLCFLKVHNPNNPSPRWKGKSPGGGNYLDALMELDDNSGQVVQAIRDLAIDQNTLVVWTTDNGASI